MGTTVPYSYVFIMDTYAVLTATGKALDCEQDSAHASRTGCFPAELSISTLQGK